MNKKFFSRIFIRIRNIIYFFVLLLTGCHTQNIHLTAKAFSGSYNTLKNAIAFFEEIHLWLPASGIPAIPDGGIPRTLYKNTALYHLQIKEKFLNKIHDFGNLPYNYSRWKTKVAYGTSLIVFSITPIEGWKEFTEINPQMKKYETMHRGVFLYNLNTNNHTYSKAIRISLRGEYPIISSDDSTVIYTRLEKKKYSLIMYNTDTGGKEILANSVDIEPSTAFFKDKKTAYWLLQNGKWLKIDTIRKEMAQANLKNVTKYTGEIATRDLEALTKTVPYTEWGFYLPEYCPKTTKGFIKDIIKMRGNLEYRIAILQLLQNKLSPGKIYEIIEKLRSKDILSGETFTIIELLNEMANQETNA